MKIIIAIVGVLVIALAGYGFINWSKSPTSDQTAPDLDEKGVITIPADQLDPVSDFVPTEVYRGTDSMGDEIIFKQQDYTRYELTFEKLEYRGDLTTERGWQNDADATVYILNWQRPVEEQRVFVRTTAEPRVLRQLDVSRNLAVPPVMLNLAE